MANYFEAKSGGVGCVIGMEYKRHWVSGHHSLSSTSGWTSHGDESSLTFTYTPKSSTSTITLNFFQPITHTSTGGGYGYMAFTREGNRNGWGGGLANYNDTHGHFWTGFSTYAGGYFSQSGTLTYANNDTNAMAVGLDVHWATGNWYYAHAHGFSHLGLIEYAGDCSG